ncbi:MAG: penicillin-binding protein 2 [Candidatus Pacebacteria bacterium]|jgi:cell division protein FtsI/penicillin-binding protein 2|nr:penicillin-binding protein 2 [Candidatus Paceibacterota bacterium]
MSSNNIATARIRLVSGTIIVVALVCIAKLFHLGVIHGASYVERADRQYATPAGDVFERGSIFFTQKDGTLVSAAAVVSGYQLSVKPFLIEAPDNVYEKLSAVTPIKRDVFDRAVSQKDRKDREVRIASRLTKIQADAIQALQIPGTIVAKEKWRFYPGGSMAAHALGFVAYKDNELSGRYGIERYYNDVLSRKQDGLYINFFAEVFSNISDSLFRGETREGDIVTTIEPSVQNILETELNKVMSEWSSDAVGGIIMNPKDGSIYALSVLPDFNLNEFSKVANPLTYGNPLVEDVYEFGSVVKALTMAAGLDSGVVTPETTYNDKGYVILDKARINNFDLKARGVVPMQEVLSQSLNTGVVHIMQKMGKQKFKDYMFAYGIGEKTGIDLPNEISGLVDNLHSPRAIEYATASFGQGIALTPMAATRALAVLANGGTLVTPHIATKIRYVDGTEKKLEHPMGQRVLTPETSEEISRMLSVVVDRALLGGTVKMEHYSISAKTGTAQMAREDGRGYYDDRYLHSFFGYFPSYDPRYLIFLYNVNPKNIDYASKTLTTPFINLSKFLLSYYDVPPDR